MKKPENIVHSLKGARETVLPQSVRGVVLVELGVVIPLFLILFLGMIDVTFICREQIVLYEAARVASRVVLVAPEFDTISTDPIIVDQEELDYVTARYRRAIFAARTVVERNGFNPNHYNYTLTTAPLVIASATSSLGATEMVIHARSDASRFSLVPTGAYLTCVRHGFVAYGVLRNSGFEVFEPEADTSC